MIDRYKITFRRLGIFLRVWENLLRHGKILKNYLSLWWEKINFSLKPGVERVHGTQDLEIVVDITVAAVQYSHLLDR